MKNNNNLSSHIFFYNNFSESVKKILFIYEFKKKPVVIKFGIDLTDKSLHIGHLFILIFLKKILIFFKKKITIKIVLGDYTTFINNKIKKKRIFENLKKIKKQLISIIGKKNIKYILNSIWLKKIDIEKIFSINISKLIKKNDDIKKKTIGNIVYPYLQNFDNKVISPDIEIGGKDQLFNFSYKKKKNNKNIFFFLFPLICGIKGKRKMSKSEENNKISLKENYKSVFWKFMNISDENSLKILNQFRKIIKIKLIKGKINKNILIKISLFRAISIFFLKKKKINKCINYFLNKKCFLKKVIKINKPKNVIDIFIKNKIIDSKKKMKSLIRQNSIKINKKILKNFNFVISKKSIVNFGKKKIYVIKIEKR
ncbi:tyrosine--tRNA ligase [Candidatus Vidania fulgoroideorum]